VTALDLGRLVAELRRDDELQFAIEPGVECDARAVIAGRQRGQYERAATVFASVGRTFLEHGQLVELRSARGAPALFGRDAPVDRACMQGNRYRNGHFDRLALRRDHDRREESRPAHRLELVNGVRGAALVAHLDAERGENRNLRLGGDLAWLAAPIEI